MEFKRLFFFTLVILLSVQTHKNVEALSIADLRGMINSFLVKLNLSTIAPAPTTPTTTTAAPTTTTTLAPLVNPSFDDLIKRIYDTINAGKISTPAPTVPPISTTPVTDKITSATTKAPATTSAPALSPICQRIVGMVGMYDLKLAMAKKSVAMLEARSAELAAQAQAETDVNEQSWLNMLAASYKNSAESQKASIAVFEPLTQGDGFVAQLLGMLTSGCGGAAVPPVKEEPLSPSNLLDFAILNSQGITFMLGQFSKDIPAIAAELLASAVPTMPAIPTGFPDLSGIF